MGGSLLEMFDLGHLMEEGQTYSKKETTQMMKGLREWSGQQEEGGGLGKGVAAEPWAGLLEVAEESSMQDSEVEGDWSPLHHHRTEQRRRAESDAGFMGQTLLCLRQ